MQLTFVHINKHIQHVNTKWPTSIGSVLLSLLPQAFEYLPFAFLVFVIKQTQTKQIDI